MGTSFKTGCILCGQNCGLEITIEDNRIVKVKPDKTNAKSDGYICRKGMNIAYHQHNADRLKYPMKKVGDHFEKISWDQAIDEIAAKLKNIVDRFGPRSFAYMGGGGQGFHFEGIFGIRLLRGLGSRYHYNAANQEFAGMFWVHGRMFGRQGVHTAPDIANTDLLLAMGWNGMQSHQIPQAPRHLQRISKDPDKLLVVVDPRISETARIADLHLPIRPGTDALLLRSMIAILLQEGWYDREYIEKHTSGFETTRHLFENFDIRAAIRTCHLEYGQIHELCRLFATRKSSLRYDLGLYMNRHSAISSYLANYMLAICGRLGASGGTVFNGHMLPLGSNSDERDPRTWRGVETNVFPTAGMYPPNIMPEEILSDHPDRLRAVFVTGSNPLRSYSDTTAYERAFKHLDLLVTAEIVMSETAALSHYVLPSRSGYESWDGTFFALTYPGIYFQMRRPILEPEGEPLECGEIHLRLADRLGLIPAIPESLHRAAESGREPFGAALKDYLEKEPAARSVMPFIIGKTLGRVMGSVHLSMLWALLQTAPKSFEENAIRAGFHPGPKMQEEIFQEILDHPEGIWIGRIEPSKNLENIHTEEHRIELCLPELDEELLQLDAEHEEKGLARDPSFPLILMAGRHTSMNANTLMRDPSWNEGKRACTLAMHPDDAAELHLHDGQQVRISTEAGSEEIELELTDAARKGHVTIPHGFGLVYNGKAFGVNVNHLTKNTHRDAFGTPMHRYVPCRVEPA